MVRGCKCHTSNSIPFERTQVFFWSQNRTLESQLATLQRQRTFAASDQARLTQFLAAASSSSPHTSRQAADVTSAADARLSETERPAAHASAQAVPASDSRAVPDITPDKRARESARVASPQRADPHIAPERVQSATSSATGIPGTTQAVPSSPQSIWTETTSTATDEATSAVSGEAGAPSDRSSRAGASNIGRGARVAPAPPDRLIPGVLAAEAISPPPATTNEPSLAIRAPGQAEGLAAFSADRALSKYWVSGIDGSFPAMEADKLTHYYSVGKTESFIGDIMVPGNAALAFRKCSYKREVIVMCTDVGDIWFEFVFGQVMMMQERGYAHIIVYIDSRRHCEKFQSCVPEVLNAAGCCGVTS